MADHDVTTLWTESDDDALRQALLSLRADVDTGGMPDPAFVRSRGTSIRRRRYAGWTAGVVASAAAVAIIVTASGILGGSDNHTRPGGSTGSASAGPSASSAEPSAPSLTTTGRSTAPDPLASGGILPIAVDWEQAAGLRAAPTVQAQPKEGSTDLCSLVLSGSLNGDERVVTSPTHPDSTLVGTQRSFGYGKAAEAAADAKAARTQANTNCPGPHTLTAVAASAVPAGTWAWKVVLDGKTGWIGFAQKGTGLTYLEVPPNGAAADQVTQSAFTDLLATALARLDRYAASSTTTSTR